jgi:hypothetical protein
MPLIERKHPINCRHFFGLVTVALCAVAPALTLAEPEYLKNLPKEGEVPYGKVVYVDDGKCPRGQIKEITGGSQEKLIPRTTRCVRRPAQSK